jgi:predicted aspartyl protease
MRPLALLAPLLLAACATTGAPAPGACGFVARSTLPITRIGPFAAVDSTIDGAPARLLVDTGDTALTVLSAAAAQRSGVALDPHRTLRTSGIGGAATYPTGRIGRLMLGNIAVAPAVVTVMPAVPLADGNIGMDILSDVDLDLDLPAGRITLHRGRLCPGAGPPWDTPATELHTAARTWRRLPASAPPSELLLEMELNGVPALALLDTGAGHTVVAGAFAARLGVTDAALAAGPALPLPGLSPQAGRGWLWRFREARIGTERFTAPVMVVADLHNPGYDVVLGMDYLTRHRVWLSYGARRIFVAVRGTPPAGHPAP